MNDNTNRESLNSVENVEVTGFKPNESPQPSSNDEDLTPEDPYNELGFGFKAWFNMLWTFILLFSLFTIIMLPAMFIYGRTDGLYVESNAAKTSKAKYSVGNLGFSGSTCISQYVGLSNKNREIVCLQGAIGELYSYGVLPNNFENKFSSETDKIEFEKGYAFCGKTNDT